MLSNFKYVQAKNLWYMFYHDTIYFKADVPVLMMNNDNLNCQFRTTDNSILSPILLYISIVFKLMTIT